MEPSGEGRLVLGRPSAAADAEPSLSPAGAAPGAAWRADGASNDWCMLRAASVAGVRHRLAGQGPEDSYAWAHLEGVLAVAVADGVGSRPGSAATSERACSASVRAALAQATSSGKNPVAGAEEAVRAAVEAANLASEGGGATTLVVAVIRPDGSGAIGRVGDSSAWRISEAGGDREIFDPPDPERADTATMALPAVAVEPEVRRLEGGPGTVLALVTDGVGDPWRDGPTTVAPALAAALLGRPDPIQLLTLVNFSRQGCHDDRTMVAVWVG